MASSPVLHSRLETRYPPPALAPPYLPPSQPSISPSAFDPHMKEKSHIDITLDAPYIGLRGTSGTTVEPGVLSGQVSLYLSEDTDIREVSLHFRGKAKIPVPTTESLINNSSMQSYTFCSHDWSFLENGHNPSTTISSGKRSLPHVRTLKAGRHVFPFTFPLTGNLPSTLTTQPLNLNSSAFPSTARASITYKLHAIASRPGLSLGPGPFHNVHITPMMLHNLTCKKPVYVLRSLTSEALEYQLSTEMENTWPGKLMYSIMLPHRAWAAGDKVVAVLKLSPLTKGVWVENVVTTLWETTELLVPQHHNLKDALHLPRHGDKSKVVHSVTRIVRCVKHKIVNGKAVREGLSGASAKPSRGTNTAASSEPRPGLAMGHSSSDTGSSIDSAPRRALAEEGFENHDVVTYITFPLPHLTTGTHLSPQNTPISALSPSLMSGSTTSVLPQSRSPSPPLGFSSHSYSPTSLPAPGSSTTPSSFGQSSSVTINPTHNLPPIVISHRIRWSFSIHNHDGHTSELRCSLPIHILDGGVLSEARDASVLTRRMALESEGLWRGEEDEEDLGLRGGGVGAEGGELNESGDVFVDRELPSYMSHVRDRVANMYYPETATVRVPWVDIAAGGEGSATEDLNWNDGNVEGSLFLSLPHPHSHQYQGSSRSEFGQNDHPHRHHRHPPRFPSAPSSPSTLEWVNSNSFSSLRRRATTHNAIQPTGGRQTHSEVDIRSATSEGNHGSSSGLSDENGQGTGGGHPKNLSSFLKAIIRPFTAFNHQGNGGHRRISKASLPQGDSNILQVPSSGPSSRRPLRTRSASIPSAIPSTTRPQLRPSPSASPIINRSISEVPDYAVASQGFMGGVPPLSSLIGLPSYEESAREGHSRQQTEDHNLGEYSSTSRNHGNDSTDSLGVLVTCPSLGVDNGISTLAERPPAI